MKLVACKLSDVVAARGLKGTKNLEIIEEFIESGYECAKVEGWTNATAFSAAGSLNRSIQRFNKAGIKAISSKNEVYLVKEK